MQLKLITAPAAEPVTLDEAKAQCRIESVDTSQDATLNGYISAARQLVENETGLALCSQTWELQLSYFPRACDGEGSYYGVIRPPKPPFQSCVSLSYQDQNGNTLTLTENTDFECHFDATSRAHVIPSYLRYWPVSRWYPGAVKLRYVAGYGDASAVPQALKQAILLIVGDWMENREAEVITNAIPKEVLFGVNFLLKDYKDWTFGEY
jgi:uncharacterized phiE125 gp8 family phage protein